MAYQPEWDLRLAYGESREEAFGRIAKFSTVECKSDRSAADTGNVFVEYEQNGRPSGLAITRADVYAFEIGESTNRWIVIPTDDLKRIAREIFVANGRQGTPGGDNGNVGVLVPIWRLYRDAPHITRAA